MKPLGRFPRQSQRRVHRYGDCSIMGLFDWLSCRQPESGGIFNDAAEASRQRRITYHREGIQNAFPDQDPITSHLMAVEVVEGEESEAGEA